MKTGFVYSDIYLKHNYPDHPERKERLITIMSHLEKKGILKNLNVISPRRATVEEVALNHDPAYIQEIHDFCTAGGGFLDSDTYATPDSYEVALTAVGGVLEGIDRILKGEVEAVFCAVRPPGHHAEFAKAMGFCLFNNIAIGARYLLNKGKKRIYIIDFDAHHGNGTQKSFYEEDCVFYFSTHQYPFYPGTGSDSEKGAGKGLGYTLNIPMSAFSGDAEFIPVYQTTLRESFLSFNPDFVLISAGYDLHREDPLTHLSLSTEGVRKIVRSIVSLCCELGSPVLFALEGGYNLKALSECVEVTLKELLIA